MNIKRKLFIILIIVSLLSVVFIVTKINKNKKTSVSNTTPTPSTQYVELPNDDSFNKSLENLNQQYPWYSKLPIETDKYRVVYDFTEKKFRIRIKKELINSQMDEVVQSAIDNLKTIGVTEPVNYYIFNSEGEKI